MSDNTKEILNCEWKTDAGVCGKQFIFGPRDKEFYAARGYTKPKYCKEHRETRRKQHESPFAEALRQSRHAV